MKKKRTMLRFPGGSMVKILLKMKLLIILMLAVVAVSTANNTYSQAIKFDLKLNDVTVKQVFQEIEENSEFILLYNEKALNINRRVNVKVKNEPVESILDQVFEGTRNVYRIYDRQIVILEDENADTPATLKTNAVEAANSQQQKQVITGMVTDRNSQPLPGVSVVVKGTTIGTVTGTDGTFSLTVPDDVQSLQFSFVGMKTKDVPLEGQTSVNVAMEEDVVGMDEVIVVGYGTQKKSDITGTVASVPNDRLEMVPNLDVAQAIQGAIPGIMIQTTSAGAAPNENIMIRGRNSIRASNNPLIVVDGIPYGGNLSDVNINDVKSIEVLKDASAAAIYGSRGANGVILVTTKTGSAKQSTISYDGYYSVQDFVKLPDVMNGEEFYNFKQQRWPDAMTLSEEAIYEAGPDAWVDWLDLGLRKGHSQQHNLSASGTCGNTNYYIAGGVLDVQGLLENDDYLRLTSRINVDTKFGKWLTLGTRTQFSYDDKSGSSPSIDGLFWMNPLTKNLDENGNYLIYPWSEDTFFEHPMAPTLYKNKDESYQILTNNYAIVDVPFIPGLSYRLNTGIRFRFNDDGTYRGRNTKSGYEANGRAETQRARHNNSVIENILSYQREFEKHSLFLTGVYSYENDKYSSNGLSARGFPHDFLTWYSAAQAELSVPEYLFNETTLISQMLRMNYVYNSRYLLTVTGRRDGFSGFGASTKWGLFPSVALGWNIANEDFFPASDLFNELKLRASWGLNGNQAVGAYESISRLSEENMVYAKTTYAGYVPSVLGQDELGWESSRTINVGLDVGLLNNRFTGTINVYKTNTTDLLLNRTISAVHGITSITQNIGETQNTGFEVSLTSRNIVSGDFKWFTSGNLSYMKNEIVSLYGTLDDEGKEIDDVANAWFIGEPIRVNYDWAWDGVWQLDEAEEAAKYGSQPGFVKLRDVKTDGQLTGEDRVIIGQQDPKFLWGMTNSFSYKNFSLNIFMHGVHGVTRHNSLMTDEDTYSQARRRTINKNYWTPENPTNDWVANVVDAERMSGIIGNFYENASFVRIKDISLSYDFSQSTLEKLRLNRLRLYITGRNLFTFTEWSGLDPELSSQVATPLQKEFVFGINLSL